MFKRRLERQIICLNVPWLKKMKKRLLSAERSLPLKKVDHMFKRGSLNVVDQVFKRGRSGV